MCISESWTGVVSAEAYLWEGTLGEYAADLLARNRRNLQRRTAARFILIEDLHQQASLTAGTITYNDELSTDFRHC
jgi:hypothetical protein